MKAEEFLCAYLNNPSPVGFECEGQKLWLSYLSDYVDETFTDIYGTAVGVINPGQDYKVVIEAHADEISWFVNYISDQGYIYVIRNGGSDHQIAPSMRVNIHTSKGIVKGVFGWPAIHVRDRAKEPQASMKNIIIDCGCKNKKEVKKLGIHVGTVITFEAGFMELNKRYYCGRALDNRIGGYIIAQAARLLAEAEVKLPYTLYIVNSVQEEIGLKGAEMIANRLKPDLALITDVCHDTMSPLYNPKEQGAIKAGSGPVLSYAPAVHNKVLEMLIKTAQANNIPFQRLASSRYTGTDTDSFAYANDGVASALISTPLKYMHTTVETAHKKDVKQVSQLMAAFLKQLNAGHNFSYFA